MMSYGSYVYTYSMNIVMLSDVSVAIIQYHHLETQNHNQGVSTLTWKAIIAGGVCGAQFPGGDNIVIFRLS